MEIKLLAAAADLPRIASMALVRDRLLSQAEPVRQQTTYYDTPGLALARRGVGLRLRRQGQERQQAVKTLHSGEAGDGAGIAIRREWQWPVAGDCIDTALLRHGDLAELIPADIIDHLAPMFTTDIQRTSLLLQMGGEGQVELALDLGQVMVASTGNAAPASHIISEVELELRRGSVADLFRLAADIHSRIPLRLSTRSKADLGLALLTGAQPHAVPARPLAITPITSVTEAFRHVARNGLAHLLDNQPAFTEANGDAAALRELAAAVRRLDVGYALFRPLIGTDLADQLRDALRQLGRRLARARDWQKLALALADLPPDVRHKTAGPVSTARARALDKAHVLLRSPAWTGWQLEFAAWLEGGEWAAPSPDCPFGTTMGEMAGTMLAQRLETLQGLPMPDSIKAACSAHKRLRKLRYALDFCRAVWPADRVAPLLGAVDAVLVPLKQAADSVRAARLLDKIGLEKASAAMTQQAEAALAAVPGLWAELMPLLMLPPRP